MSSQLPPKLIVMDIEAAGLQIFRPLIQIAAIAVDESFRELEVFEAKIRFRECEATRRTLRRRHYRRAVWNRDARPARDVAADFGNFLRRHATLTVRNADGSSFPVAQLVAHNGAFDGPMLRAWFERQRIVLPASYRVLCTLHRALWFFQEHPTISPPSDFRLETLCRYFGVPWNSRQAHDALVDVRATVGLYRAMKEHPCRKAQLPVAIDRFAV